MVCRPLPANLLDQPHVVLCVVLGSHYGPKAINDGLVLFIVLGYRLTDYDILVDLQCSGLMVR